MGKVFLFSVSYSAIFIYKFINKEGFKDDY